MAQTSVLKLLLVGPFPPPHGGVSVHVVTLQDRLQKAGIPCRVLNVGRGAAKSDRYVSIKGPGHFMFLLSRYSLTGWLLHVHINGHNFKSWLMALAAGSVGMTGAGAVLTIHSGMSPTYLKDSRSGRLLARIASKFYRHIVAVNSEISDALRSISVPTERIEIMPAYFSADSTLPALPEGMEPWLCTRHPVISTALFYRPEYGFGLLVQAIAQLLGKYPRLGCVVMGDSESKVTGANLIKKHGLEEHISAVGDVAHESCLAVMARSDIFARTTFSDGDAISVREALALGTPVVASDVVSRPPGTLCFKTGDASDLASKIEDLLSGAHFHPHTSRDNGTNGIHRLLELYSS